MMVVGASREDLLARYAFPLDAFQRRAIDALVPLARRGLLDEHVVRVLRFREEY